MLRPPSPPRRPLVPLVGLVLLACGGAEPSREHVLDDGFRRIQGYEARIDAESATLTAPETDCPRRSAAAGAVCDAAERLCALAHDLADADALARCERARDACRSARGQAPRCNP